jgi:hypothetical protein
MSGAIKSFLKSAETGKKMVYKAAPKVSPYTTTPDPENPGQLKKCFNVPDPSANPRLAGQFGSLKGPAEEIDDAPPMKIGGQYSSDKLCNLDATFADADLLTLYSEQGVMNEGLVPDEATGRVDPSTVAGWVNTLQEFGIVKSPPTVKVGDTVQVDMDQYIKQDNDLYETLQHEYCHYNERYMFALKRFLTLATSRDQNDNPAAQDTLEISRKLNLRVNSVLEVMNYISQSRVALVNSNKGSIDASNRKIRRRMTQMTGMFAKLRKDNAMVTTQREMVRYTQEKNAYTSNQIAVWTALNVLTLGAIVYVYRN